MNNCGACGRFAGRADEPCPHCGASPRAKASAAAPPISNDSLTFVDELLEDDATTSGIPAVRTPEPAPRTPTAAQMERWYSALEQSPVFAGENAGPPPVILPMDGRSIDISAKFDVPSARSDDEPVVNLLVTVTPSGPALLDRAAGPVAHVILALDVSASMNRTDKYPVLTEALAGMLYELRRPGAPDVLLSVVVYAYGAETIFRDCLASQLAPRDVLRDIDHSQLRFGRYTDMAGALKRAGRIALDQVKSQRSMPTRICILTDGRPQDVEGTRRVLDRLRTMPVDVDALAFGSDADVACLQELVSGGRGGTVKQIRPDTIAEAFGHVASTAADIIANRGIFELELRPGVVGGGAYRYRPARHRYGIDQFQNGRTFKTDLGTLESGRDYSLLFELRLPESQTLETEVGRITVRIPGHGGPRTFESLVALPRHKGIIDFAVDREVQTARDILAALGASDPSDHLKALRTRRGIYESERRDPQLIAIIDRAIDELEQRGTLKDLSAGEQAALLSHTATVGRVR